MGNYSPIEIDAYPAKPAELALANYLNAWGLSQWQEMFDLTQLTWQNDKKLVNLKQLLGGVRLLTAEIGEQQDIAALNKDVLKDFSVTISYMGPLWAKKQRNKIRKATIIVRLICEESPFNASKKGQWGVNPISALRGMNGN